MRKLPDTDLGNVAGVWHAVASSNRIAASLFEDSGAIRTMRRRGVAEIAAWIENAYRNNFYCGFVNNTRNNACLFSSGGQLSIVRTCVNPAAFTSSSIVEGAMP